MTRTGVEIGSAKIVVSGAGIDERLLGPLYGLGCEVVPIGRREPPTAQALRHELAGAVAYLHGGEELVTEEALELADGLRVIAFLGLGYETFIDAAAVRRRGIVVTNTPERTPDAVAEFTVGQIINASRRIPRHLGTVYPHWSGADELPDELVSKKIGIVGLGQIGTRIAGILRLGFGCRVSYYNRTRREDLEMTLGVRFRQLPELAEWSDVLVVMVGGNAETAALIDRRVLGRVRPGTILVNTARASVVDPGALRDALARGGLGMAVFDGYYQDSTVAKDLLNDFGDRMYVTGHIASHTKQSMERMVRQAVDSVVNLLNGRSDPNVVIR
ncbi:2-hydroxyacid dehydrogenase [Microtetraspora niveoalba]|uniref:2-hydroxyacid dehydrogenase n=1 Tax=Microtetraspora niveoalba TaxID=46175 RepID=UPI001470E38A|nr:NAD(P)-dependent oxidoreductase [Microtetraspora niveoalba]